MPRAGSEVETSPAVHGFSSVMNNSATAGAAMVIYAGLVLPWTGSPALNMAVTFLWLIGITNAVNMLDNMDGLSAGVSAIAAVFLGINFATNGQWAEAACREPLTAASPPPAAPARRRACAGDGSRCRSARRSDCRSR